MSSDLPETPDWEPEHVALAVEAAGVGVWAWNVDTDRLTMDRRGSELWGIPWSKKVTFEELSSHIHPSDRDRVRAAFNATRAVLGAYETDFRILIGDKVRWISARGKGDDADMVGRTMFGIFLDVTRRKQAEESQELLVGEMSHRVKNLLSIAGGLTAITSRAATDVEDMTRQLTGRLKALGRAHDLVRPLPDGQGEATLLGDLLTIWLAPYEEQGAFKGRIKVSVERLGVGEAAATSVALVMHELATNSMKYGSLSDPSGTLEISSLSEDDQIVLTWAEQGGPDVEAPEDGDGFGSGLVNASIARLGGAVDYDWSDTGLVVELKMARAQLAL